MKKDKLINLRVSEAKHSDYVKLAEGKGIKLSELIRILLEKEMQGNGNSKN